MEGAWCAANAMSKCSFTVAIDALAQLHAYGGKFPMYEQKEVQRAGRGVSFFLDKLAAAVAVVGIV